MNSRCAIATLERPSAISASTSRSLGVSRATGSARERRVISLPTTTGSSTVPPAATVRMAAVNASGLEGAVRLGYRAELDAIEDPEARRARCEEPVAEQYARGKALSTAAAFEIDDLIDPADTRAVLTGVLAQAAAGGWAPQAVRDGGSPARSGAP